MLVQRTLERIDVQLEEAPLRAQRQRFVVDLVNLLPVVHLGHESMAWPFGHEMLEAFLDELATLHVHNVGGLLLERAQIRSHFVAALRRRIQVELDEVAQHVVVEANHRSVGGHAVEQLHFGRGPAQIGLWVGVDGVLMRLRRVELVHVERPVLAVGHDGLGGQRVGEVVERRESLVAGLTEQPSKAAENGLRMNRLLVVLLAVRWIAQRKVAATQIGDTSEFVLGAGPVAYAQGEGSCVIVVAIIDFVFV